MHIIRMIPSLIQTGVFCLCLGLGLLISLPFLVRKRGKDPFGNYYDGKRKNK